MRPPITTAHTRVQGLGGPQNVTAIGGTGFRPWRPATGARIPWDHILRGTRCPSPRSRIPRVAKDEQSVPAVPLPPQLWPFHPCPAAPCSVSQQRPGHPGLHSRLHEAREGRQWWRRAQNRALGLSMRHPAGSEGDFHPWWQNGSNDPHEGCWRGLYQCC